MSLQVTEFPDFFSKQVHSCTTYTPQEFNQKYGKNYEIYKSQAVGKYVKDAFDVIEKSQENLLFNKKTAKNQVVEEVMGLSEVQVKIGSRVETYYVRLKN